MSIDRRALVLAALMAGVPLAAAALSDNPPNDMEDAMARIPRSWTGSEEIAMLVYPQMTALDIIAPQHYFASLMGAKVRLVGKTPAPVTSDTGVTITPTATFETCPKDVSVIFVPGGTAGTLAAMRDNATLAFLADRGSRAAFVTSVCTGSLVLGAAGLLSGYKATSHWAARDVLADFGAEPVKARVVHDRNRITGAGVTAGLDFGLSMVAMMRDETYAQGVQLQSEYDPDPPFRAGSPDTAPEEVRRIIEPMTRNFVSEARKVARSRRT